MKILYSSSGDTALLAKEYKRFPPSFDLMTECAGFLAKVNLCARSGKPAELNVERLDARGIRESVAKCEPPRFLLFRDLTVGIRRDCERLLPNGVGINPAKKVCVRFPRNAHPTELLAAGIFAKYCGVSELVFSISKEGYLPEHALAARLCDVKEFLLCDELECVAEAAFGDRYDILTGRDSEIFSVASGLVSSFLDVRVRREVKGYAFVFTSPYSSEPLACDVMRELAEHSSRQLLLISASEKDALSALGGIDSDRVTMLITSSDGESLAVARKLDALDAYVYGGASSELASADGTPPLMREVFTPSSAFGVSPYDFLLPSPSFECGQGVEDFARLLAKHAAHALSAEEKETVAARL